MAAKRKSIRVENGEVRYQRTGDDLDAARLERIGFDPFADSANADVVDPREHQMVAKGGSWAMITRALPPMEFDLHKEVRVGRVFHVQHFSNADNLGFLPEGTYKVTCHAPWHELTLWPYEYSVVPPVRLLDYWQEGALIFHPMGVEDGRFNDVVFYARSRGIDVADAMVMALGTLQGPVGWFEPHPSIAADIEALAERINTPLWKHVRDNPRQQRKEKRL
jgi:hypothetical protein